MRVNTTEYEFNHGKKPRGYGNWWFSVEYADRAGRGSVVYITVDVSAVGTYTDARKAAIKDVRETHGATEIIEVKVLP